VSETQQALAKCRLAFATVGIFSAAINVLMLTGSLYMLQVYDRVLPSGSMPTLIGLSILALAAYLLLGGLDWLRTRILSRIGARFDEMLSGRVFAAAAALPLAGVTVGDSLHPLRDLDKIRGFLSGLGPVALFDMPFMPVFMAGCFLIHPWMGWIALCGAAAIVALTLLTEARSRAPLEALNGSALARHAFMEASRRNAEVVRALGMRASLTQRFAAFNGAHIQDSLRVSQVTLGSGAVARTFRLILQSAALGLGAYLVIKGEMSGGAMIASSILISRAMAPIEIAVAHWNGFAAARQGYRRVVAVLKAVPESRKRLDLPAPSALLSLDGVSAGPPGAPAPFLQGISFKLRAGQALGLIGPSASGKSTLARVLVGVWPTSRGEVRLDGATLDQWEADSLGRSIGYLPQDVELFDGSVAENIARFRPDASPKAIIAAGQAAGAHEMILTLPHGYETRIGEGGSILSGGQRQRIGLARALFGDPFLVVLDEPNANLDGAGDEALNAAIWAIRARSGIAIVITHRPSALGHVDLLGYLEAGALKAFGPRDEVLQSLMRRNMVTSPDSDLPGSVRRSPIREAG
jgi:ATP-binding cassette subfamily C protein